MELYRIIARRSTKLSKYKYLIKDADGVAISPTPFKKDGVAYKLSWTEDVHVYNKARLMLFVRKVKEV